MSWPRRLTRHAERFAGHDGLAGIDVCSGITLAMTLPLTFLLHVASGQFQKAHLLSNGQH